MTFTLFWSVDTYDGKCTTGGLHVSRSFFKAIHTSKPASPRLSVWEGRGGEVKIQEKRATCCAVMTNVIW